MDYKSTKLKDKFPSIEDTGKSTSVIWPMAYHKNRVRRSSAFASGRYSSLVPAVLEQQEQKTLDARDEKERRKRKKQRAAERISIEDLMKQIEIMQQEHAEVPVYTHTYQRDDSPEQDCEMEDRISSMIENREEKEAQDTLKYVVDELDKLKVSLEEVRDIVIMKSSRRHMEWSFHSARFASTIQGTWQATSLASNQPLTKCKSPRSGYSERMLHSSTFHSLYDDFSTPSSDEKANIVEITDDELSHSTSILPMK